MPAYFAFLRGLNVGGNGMLPMSQLREMFTRAGFQNVKTFIQSGNVSVDSHLRSEEAVARKMEAAIKDSTDLNAEVFVRTREYVEQMVKNNPFGKTKRDEKTVLYVQFLSKNPPIGVPSKLKCVNKGEAELIGLRDNIAYIISRKKGTQFGHPDLEKQFKLRATSRNWNTILRMVKNPA